VVEAGGVGVANVTPDGRFLVFTSHLALTEDVSRTEGPAQVYRYDAQAETLTRVSIGQAGFNDNGNASAADARIAPAYQDFLNGDGPGRSNPTVSEDGQLVFFESPAGLTPEALDDKPVTGNPQILAENIYEWEADGTQPSTSAPACADATGCVSLISDGKDLNEGSNSHENASAVQLLGSDNSGKDVFFWTADALLPQDVDSQLDLYDARVDGGVPSQPEAQQCVTLEACHGSVSEAPVFGAPLSSTFSGPGNQVVVNPTPAAPTVKSKVKVVTRAQKLAKALKGCRAKRSKRKRSVCEKKARNTYRRSK
jgi:hypothetical protein